MAGHTSEKRWRSNQNTTFGNIGVSDTARDLCRTMIQALDDAKTGYSELQEIYAYAGGTVQGLADQLFLEDWSTRSTPGVNATLTVDVAGGAVTAVTITNAGTAYTNGTGYTLRLVSTAGGGDTTAILSYDVVAGSLTNAAVDIGGASYTDGTGITVIETPAAGVIYDTQANTEELGKAQDLFDAVTALNELYSAADNGVVAQEDRLSQMRRMT
jgi:hypothetical protein